MQLKNNILPIFIVFGIFAALVSCGKKEQDQNTSLIPKVAVNFYIQPNTIDYIPVTTTRVYEYEGYRGVLIYRLDEYTFLAYEMTCPWDPDKPTAKVEFDPTTYTLVDSTCMSIFNIIDGMPAGGPSNRPLLQYQTEFDGNYLHIFNPY